MERYVYYVERDMNDIQWYNFCGVCHSDYSFPSRIITYRTMSVYIKLWHRNGKLERKKDQPMMVVQYYDDKITTKRWGSNDMVDRGNDLPVVVEFDRNEETVYFQLEVGTNNN